MISEDDAFKIRNRISILIKAAELIYRDVSSLKKKDLIYYLDQIIEETTDCKNIVDPGNIKEKTKSDMC